MRIRRFLQRVVFHRRQLLVGLCVAIIGLSAMLIRAQSPVSAALPSFEVASIKKLPPDNSDVQRIFMGGADVSQYHATNVTAMTLIGTAYSVKDFQISGGPAWIKSEHWAIDAKVEDSLAAQLQKLPRQQQQNQTALMLRSLLLDRFKLQITRATKEGTVLALVVGKGGAKLKEVRPPDAATLTTPPARPPEGTPTMAPPGAMMYGMNGDAATVGGNAVPISNLVTVLTRLLGQQVLDQTGLAGTYQFTLQFAPPSGASDSNQPPGAQASTPDSSAPSIFTALQEQLGLRLESTKGQMEIITIDHIEEPQGD